MDYENRTIREAYYWAYANLAMAHIAYGESAKKYVPHHYGIRQKIYNDLLADQISIRSLFDDEKAKIEHSNTCCYCGSTNNIETDHLIPRSKGGTDSGDNLIPACKACNSSKKDKDMLTWIRSKGQTPSILLYRRYLKLAISYYHEHELMDELTTSSIVVPFDVTALFDNELALSEVTLSSLDSNHMNSASQLKPQFRIANWNLERARKGVKLDRALEHLKTIDADIVGLTEITKDVAPKEFEYFLLAKPFESQPLDISSGLFSKWPIIEIIETYDPKMAICGRINSPFGDIIVYVSIIPYGMSAVRGGKYGNLGYKPWQMHQKHIHHLNSDWQRIQKAHQGIPLIALGDFNQVRDTKPGGYGPKYCRDQLTEALSNNSLNCLTEIDFAEEGFLLPDPKTGLIRRNIDHICISELLVESTRKIEVGAWNHFNENGQRMSDHNGTYVDLFIKQASYNQS